MKDKSQLFETTKTLLSKKGISLTSCPHYNSDGSRKIMDAWVIATTDGRIFDDKMSPK